MTARFKFSQELKSQVVVCSHLKLFISTVFIKIISYNNCFQKSINCNINLGTECIYRGNQAGRINFETTTVPTQTTTFSDTDLGTVVGVPVVLLLSCIILAIMFYCRCYIPAQRKKTLERAHVTYIADPTSRPGRTIIF